MWSGTHEWLSQNLTNQPIVININSKKRKTTATDADVIYFDRICIVVDKTKMCVCSSQLRSIFSSIDMKTVAVEREFLYKNSKHLG